MLRSEPRLPGKMILMGAAAMTIAQLASGALGANANWTGLGNDGLWATGANWSATPAPGSGNNATFNSAGNGFTTIDLGAGVTLANVVYDTSSAASYTIGTSGSQTITVGNTSGFIVNAGVTNNQLVNATVSLGAGKDGSGYTFTNSSPTATITFAGGITSLGSTGTAGGKALAVTGVGNYVFSGVVSNGTASNTSITKSGTGRLTLTGTNTYTGGTTVTGGELLVDFSAAGAPTTHIINNTNPTGSALTLNGGTLNVKLSNSATANSQRFNGATFSTGTSAFRITQNGNTGGGTVVTLGGLTRSNNGTVDFTLPTTGTITTTSNSSSAYSGTNKVLVASGVAYATADATHWVVNNSGTFGTTSGSYVDDTFTASADINLTTNNAPAAFTVNTLRFNTPTTLTLNSSGNSVVTAGGILVTAAGTGSTIASGGAGAGLTSGTTAKEVVIHNYSSLSVAAPVVNNGASAVVLTHTGTGTTTFSAANTNTGGTIINSGTLKLGSGGALGGAAVTIRSAGTFDMGGQASNLASNVTNAGVITNTGSTAALTLGAAGNTNSGSITGNVNLVLGNTTATAATALAGTINPTGTITNNGGGSGSAAISGLIGSNVTSITQNSTTSNLTLTAPNQSNPFSGPVYVLAGQLSALGNAGANNPLGSGTVYLGANSGANDATLSFDQTGTVANPIIVQSGSTGTLALRAHNTSGGVSSTGLITLNNNLSFVTPTGQNGGNTYSGGITGTGNVTIALGSTAATSTGLTIQTGAVNFTGSITNSGTGTRGASISSAIGANVTSITQDSATSSLSLSGTNTSFVGPITIKAGTLSFSTTGASIGGGTSAIQLGTAGSADATLGVNGNLPYARAVSVNAGDGLRTLTMSGNSQFDGAITLGDDLRVQNTGGGVIQVRGGITGTGDVTLQTNSGNSGSTLTINTVGVNHVGRIINSGTVNAPATITSSVGANVTSLRQESAVSPFVLSGNNTNFAGTVYVTTGLMTATTSNSLNNNAIVANLGGTLRLDGAITTTIGGLDGSATGAVYGNPGTGTATMKLDGSGTYNFLGTISDDNNDAGAKILTLNKTGSGTQALGGTNTYTGATAVNGGTLLVNGSLAAGSAVTVGNNATLGGSGVVNGSVAINTGGKIAPGNSVDDLATGNLTLSTGTNYVWEINDATGVAGGGAGPTAGWDLLNINGTLTVSATEASPVTVNVVSLNGTAAGQAANFNPNLSYQFLIADATSSITFNPLAFSLVTSGFANTNNGAWSLVRGDDSSITLGDSSQLYVKYTAVPEPATLGALALGAMGLLRRRRAC